MKATTAVTQTLICHIGDLSNNVEVSWKAPDGKDVTDDMEGYSVTQGSVDDENVQKSTLTVDSPTLTAMDTSSPVEFKCSAKSLQYPNSVPAPYQNLVVSFLTFG